jgi:hypothetical protein
MLAAVAFRSQVLKAEYVVGFKSPPLAVRRFRP